MKKMESKTPERLAEIVDDFAIVPGREKLEYLLEFAESLPDLPEWLAERRDEMEQVHECMTPVFVFASLSDGTLDYYFDVPAESPTVRGFAAIVQQGTQGLSPEEVLAIPNDFYMDMGLQSVLTAQRLNGMAAILAYIKRLALEQVQAQ